MANDQRTQFGQAQQDSASPSLIDPNNMVDQKKNEDIVNRDASASANKKSSVADKNIHKWAIRSYWFIILVFALVILTKIVPFWSEKPPPFVYWATTSLDAIVAIVLLCRIRMHISEKTKSVLGLVLDYLLPLLALVCSLAYFLGV